MGRTSSIVIIALLLQQYIQITTGVTCQFNPCQLTAADALNGYCCYNIPPNYVDALCTCPNNIAPVVNAPCRYAGIGVGVPGINPTICTKTCVNGGVCNIVNGQQVCWCQLGFSGENCEIQGITNRCYAGLCQTGTCYEQTVGITTYAFCRCQPGCRGIQCNQCYFTCPNQGAFSDTAQCGIGRYFYCSQAFAIPIAATCPAGQKFNRFTNQCDSTYQCT
ncbi:unnamed protein product [Adineta steineri]|uniref:Uncharacterized protein n=1 Tax=Adineta steineri TaxID=433720 RepID=A0A814LZJ6_9BILA|nr:unnamed protein product [Adineta steineri]CAF1499389.1 unnamed protein product [Adineta steineri]